MVSVLAAPAWRVTFVLPETDNCAIVSVGTLVTIVVALLSKTRTSVTAGVVLVGVQFVAVVYAAVPV